MRYSLQIKNQNYFAKPVEFGPGHRAPAITTHAAAPGAAVSH